MVSKQKDAIDIFNKASTDCNDADIENWAIATLPDLLTNLNHSIKDHKISFKLLLTINNSIKTDNVTHIATLLKQAEDHSKTQPLNSLSKTY